MEPCKVTFTFDTPLMLDSEYPLHLDALLAWAAVDEAESFGLANAWAHGDSLEHVLESAHSPEGEWVWKASRLRFTAATERFMSSMIRKLDPIWYMEGYDRDLIDYRIKRNVIVSGSGQERAYQWLMTYQWFEKAEAWCVADKETLEEMLGRIRYVGKMSRNGFGRVASITVESDEGALEAWKIRTLPLGLSGDPSVDYADTFQCIRAPYWKKTERIHAKEPILIA